MFESSKLPLTPWFMAMQLLSQGKNNIAALELRRQLGCGPLPTFSLGSGGGVRVGYQQMI
jgi:hypothetical protein